MKHETPFICQVKLLISENLHRTDYHSDDLCKSLNISRTQLYRRLKDQSGKSFSQIQHEIKMQRAYSLLERTDRNVSEIAFALGYKDPSYFVRVFRKETGMTPGRYYARKLHTIKNIYGDQSK